MSGLLPQGQQELRKHQQVHPLPNSDVHRQAPGAVGGQKRLTQWTIIAQKSGVQNTKERLKSYWATVGVVSALMAALTYPAVTSPSVTRFNSAPGSGDVDDPLFVSYVLLNTSSLILSFVVVIISVVLLAEVDLVVSDDDLETFIDRYQYLFLALTGVFGVSMLLIIASIVTLAFFNYNKTTAICSAAICLFGTVSVAVVSAWLALWTRARLKVHISQANALLLEAVTRLRKGVFATAGSQHGQGQTAVPGSGGMGALVAAAAAGEDRAGGGGGDVSLRRKPAL